MTTKMSEKLLLKIINQSILSFLKANLGVITVDKDCSVIDINEIGERYMRIQLGTVMGKKLDAYSFSPYLQEAISTVQLKMTKEVLGDNIFYVLIVPINDKMGIVGALVILENASRWESELGTAELLDNQLDKIINSIYDGIVISSAQGHIITLNKAYEHIAGITKEEYVGKHVQRLVEEGYFKSTMTERVIATQKASSMMQKLRSGRVALISGMPVFNDRNELWRVIVTVRDMSELQNIKERLVNVEAENIHLKKELGSDLVIFSEKMKRVFDLGKMVAKTDATVLITGESGVGKEVLARYIHDNSDRRNNPFIWVNCGAIPETLLESEVFGYEKGAFTGAMTQGKKGLLDSAQNGSFLLDELGELPILLQVKFLRLLENKEYYRVGGTQPTFADIRFIAATNKDLQAMVEEGSFRADLFYRLNVVNIHIPPLRERKEDILPLTVIFLKKYNEKYDQNKRIDSSVINLFQRYDWPGNTRELQNVIERLVVISSSDLITVEDLPECMNAIAGKGRSRQNQSGLKEALEKLEKEMLINAYKQSGDTRITARILGISQSAVVKKMKKYKLDYSKIRNLTDDQEKT